MKNKLLVLVLLVFSFALYKNDLVLAADYEYTIDTTIRIGADFSTTVETIIEASDVDGSDVPPAINLPLYGTNPQGVTAKLADGKQASLEQNGNSARVLLSPIQSESGRDWSLSVSYSSSIGTLIGQSYIALLQPYDYQDINVVKESVSMSASGELGSFVTRGSTPSDSSSFAGETIQTWTNEDGPITKPLGLLFGDTALAKLTYSRTLENDGLWWQTKSIILPPDTNQQRIFLDSISPEPSAIHLDVDGNVIVDFNLRPRQKIDVTATVRATLNSYTYSIDNNQTVADIGLDIVSKYTNLNETWKDTSIEVVDTVANGPANELVEEIYDQVLLEYRDDESEDPYAAAVIRANHLIGELRANKVPARLIIGAAFGDGRSVSTAPVGHGWVEAFLPSVGWITLDPSFGVNGDYFGVADVQRVALGIRGFDPEFPPEDINSYAVTFSADDSPQQPVMVPEISTKKFMILPGIAIKSTTVALPVGIIVDRTGIETGSEEFSPLGSLAPLQSVTLRSTSFLAESFTSESVRYGIIGPDGFLEDSDILAQATMDVSYIPMVGLFLAGGLTLGAKLGLSKVLTAIKERKSSKKRSRSAVVIASDQAGESIEHIDMLADTAHDHKSSIADELRVEPIMPTKSPVPDAQKLQPQTETALKKSDTILMSNAARVQPSEIRKELKRKRPPLIQ